MNLSPLFFSLLLFVPPTLAAEKGETKSSAGTTVIEAAMAPWHEAKALEFDVSKESYIDLLEETKESTGKMFYSKGRLRLDIKKPDPWLMVLNDNTIWLETAIPADIGGGVQITKLKATKEVKKNNTILAVLFDQANIWSNFKLLSENKKEDHHRLMLRPKNPKQFASIERLEVILKDSKLSAFTYWDELDNKTTYRFLSVKALEEIDTKLFDYKPPKGAEVTEI